MRHRSGALNFYSRAACRTSCPDRIYRLKLVSIYIAPFRSTGCLIKTINCGDHAHHTRAQPVPGFSDIIGVDKATSMCEQQSALNGDTAKWTKAGIPGTTSSYRDARQRRVYYMYDSDPHDVGCCDSRLKTKLSHPPRFYCLCYPTFISLEQ